MIMRKFRIKIYTNKATDWFILSIQYISNITGEYGRPRWPRFYLNRSCESYLELLEVDNYTCVDPECLHHYFTIHDL